MPRDTNLYGVGHKPEVCVRDSCFFNAAGHRQWYMGAAQIAARTDPHHLIEEENKWLLYYAIKDFRS